MFEYDDDGRNGGSEWMNGMVGDDGFLLLDASI